MVSEKSSFCRTSTFHAFYLESQQAAVDLGRLHQSAAIVAADVRATLVSRQIDQWEFAVQSGSTVIAPQDNLQDGVGAGGVCVGWGLPWCSEQVDVEERLGLVLLQDTKMSVKIAIFIGHSY